MTLPRIAIVSFSETRGGAAKATERLFNGLRKRGIPAEYIVVEKKRGRSSARGPGRYAFAWHLFKRLLVLALQKTQRSENPTKHSLNLFSCNYVVKSLSECDLVHLHWINNETISLEKLAKINRRLIISLHDEWFYCGSEHYALDSSRPFEGYEQNNKNVVGVDWDRLTWERKRKALSGIRDRVIVTAPSRWMLERARRSKLLHGLDLRLIPNCLDTDKFSPRTTGDVGRRWGISPDSKVILFGAVQGRTIRLKGYHHLIAALELLSSRYKVLQNVMLVTFGGSSTTLPPDLGISHLEIGQLNTIDELAQLYSRATFTVVPSIVEAFGQVAAESLACGTPVLAFNTAGIKDIVAHKVSGFLADPFSPASLCRGIEWFLAQEPSSIRILGATGRRHVIENFSESVVVEKFIRVYEEHCSNQTVTA